MVFTRRRAACFLGAHSNTDNLSMPVYRVGADRSGEKMQPHKIVPVIMIGGMLAAGIVAAVCRRWLDALYWFAGALINLSVILRG